MSDREDVRSDTPAPDPRESAEIRVNGEVVGYGMLGMGAALRKLLAADDDEASGITAPSSEESP